MTAFDYSKSRATAKRLLQRFGQPVQIRRRGPAGGSPTNPTPGTATLYPSVAVVEHYAQKHVDGTLIRLGDKRVIMAMEGLTIEPHVSDEIIIAGELHTIIRVEPFAPGGVPLYCEIQARGV